MRARSGKSSKKNRGLDTALGRPFDPTLEQRARRIAQGYRLVLEPDPEVGFIGRGLELPTVFADAPTAEQCVEATWAALTAAVATMLEMGLRPPAPAARGARQAQINVRLTAEEKLLIEESSRRAGFRGVSDYVRAAALSYPGEHATLKKKPANPRRKTAQTVSGRPRSA